MKNFAFLAGFSVLGFAALALAMTSGATMPFDLGVRNAIHATASGPLTFLAFTASFLGSTALILLVSVVGAYGLKYSAQWNACRTLVIVMLGAVAINYGLKYAFQRPRPEVFFGALPETFSFPSGHALFSTCCYGMLAMILSAGRPDRGRALWPAAVALVMLIAWSRLYLGVHYPSDVVAGVLAGIAWVSLVRLCYPVKLA